MRLSMIFGLTSSEGSSAPDADLGKRVAAVGQLELGSTVGQGDLAL
jgi:hypothetical protein